MPDKLGELLIKKNLLTRGQLEEALQAQVIFGGKLGTVLIEMGLITENVLADILTQLLAITCAKPGQLQNISENVIKILSPELAEKHQAVPVSVSGKKLVMAMANPHDFKSVDELSFRTGYIIKPILALEVRLVFALERYYGIKRTMRYIAPPKQVREELNQLQVDEVKSPPPATAPTPDLIEDEELGVPGSELIREKPAADPVPQIEDEIEELGDDDLIEELVEEEVSLASTAQELIKITDRNDVADAIIKYLGANYARAALFMVVAGQVSGWRSAKDGQPIPGFDQFQLPLSEPSVLKTAVESNSYFLGPVQATGANLALTTFLGKPAPKTALMIPLTMMGRVVALVYIDDDTVDLSQAVVDIQKIARMAIMAFEILILHNKILRF